MFFHWNILSLNALFLLIKEGFSFGILGFKMSLEAVCSTAELFCILVNYNNSIRRFITFVRKTHEDRLQSKNYFVIVPLITLLRSIIEFFMKNVETMALEILIVPISWSSMHSLLSFNYVALVLFSDLLHNYQDTWSLWSSSQKTYSKSFKKFKKFNILVVTKHIVSLYNIIVLFQGDILGIALESITYLSYVSAFSLTFNLIFGFISCSHLFRR